MATEQPPTVKLRELVRQYPEDARSLAAKADEPIRSRLLRLLDEAEANGGEP